MADSQVAEQGTRFNSNMKKKHAGNGCRNGLPRRNREILPGYVSTYVSMKNEEGQRQSGINSPSLPEGRCCLETKGIKSFPSRWSDIGKGCSEHWSILAP